MSSVHVQDWVFATWPDSRLRVFTVLRNEKEVFNLQSLHKRLGCFAWVESRKDNLGFCFLPLLPFAFTVLANSIWGNYLQPLFSKNALGGRVSPADNLLSLPVGMLIFDVPVLKDRKSVCRRRMFELKLPHRQLPEDWYQILLYTKGLFSFSLRWNGALSSSRESTYSTQKENNQ